MFVKLFQLIAQGFRRSHASTATPGRDPALEVDERLFRQANPKRDLPLAKLLSLLGRMLHEEYANLP